MCEVRYWPKRLLTGPMFSAATFARKGRSAFKTKVYTDSS
jgi:hypothetical protein